MQKQDILALGAIGGYPCLTITLPTHRTSPDNRQDPIRLKNLVGQATERLKAELGRREVDSVLRSLEALAGEVDHEHNLDGLALFVGTDTARVLKLPFSLPERVMIDDRFFIRDLVYAYNRSPHYWVLALSEQPTRLFLAFRDELVEINEGTPFPMEHSGRGGGRTLPNEPALNVSQLRDEHHRIFFRKVDEALSALMAVEPLPVVVAGVERYLAFFDEVSANGEQIAARLRGNYDQTTPHELGRLVWPLAQEVMVARRAAILDELKVAVGGQRTASTLGEAWRFAQEGRGQTLLVEEGYHEAAAVDPTGMHLLPATEGGPDVLDDAVDATIATVLEKGGRVVFVDDGALAQHGRIALVLRY